MQAGQRDEQIVVIENKTARLSFASVLRPMQAGQRDEQIVVIENKTARLL